MSKSVIRLACSLAVVCGVSLRHIALRFSALFLIVTAAFADDSHSFTEAIKAVCPQARFQADHFHTVKHIWGHLKKSLVSYRRHIKAHGEEKNDEHCMERAKMLWKLRWSLLKKPANVSVEEKQAIAELEREDEGFVHSVRSLVRQLVTLFDHSHSEAQTATAAQGHPSS